MLGSKVFYDVNIELVFEEKMKNYYRDIKHIKDMFPANIIKQFENDGEIWGNIVR